MIYKLRAFKINKKEIKIRIKTEMKLKFYFYDKYEH